MEYGFTQYRHVTLLEKGAVVAEADVPYQLDGRVQLVTAERGGDGAVQGRLGHHVGGARSSRSRCRWRRAMSSARSP